MLFKRTLAFFIPLLFIILPINASFLSEEAHAGEPYWQFHSDLESTEYFDADSVSIVSAKFPYYSIRGAVWSEYHENGKLIISKSIYIFYYNVNNHVMKGYEIWRGFYAIDGTFLYSTSPNKSLITLRASYMKSFPLLTAVGEICFLRVYDIPFSESAKTNLN